MKILISTALVALLFVGCSEDPNKTIDKAATNTKEAVAKVQEATKEASQSTDEMVEKAQDVTDEVVAKTQEVIEEVKEIAAQTVEKTKKAVNEAAKEVQAATETVDVGATIYKKCAGCHGASGEKKALGKSKVIQAWSVAQTTEALNGYKDGSYGGTMKGLMKGQVTGLSDSDIEAVSEYISKL